MFAEKSVQASRKLEILNVDITQGDPHRPPCCEDIPGTPRQDEESEGDHSVCEYIERCVASTETDWLELNRDAPSSHLLLTKVRIFAPRPFAWLIRVLDIGR